MSAGLVLRRPGLALLLTRRAFAAGLLAPAAVARPAATAPGMGEMLWDYFAEYMRLLDERRQERFDSLATPEDVANIGVYVRGKLAQMWGPLPTERTPLNVQEVGEIDRGDYVIEKLIYESRPEFHVTANLYRPKEAEQPLPGVIVTCGHGSGGKTYESYQRFAILLARHGFVALAFDPIGQGERSQLWDKALGASRAREGTGEHSVLGRASYLLGLNLMQYRAWDASRSIDYLAGRPDVDANRIAMGGNSGGGMETLQFAAFETRLAAAFSGCAVASFKAKTEALLMADPEQILHGTLRYGIEHQELIAASAPRPYIIGSAIQDYVPIDAARRTFAEVQRAYRIAGHEGKVTQVETGDKHGLNKDLRVAAVDWFSRWISETSRQVKEVEGPVSTAKELRCTESGQVVVSLNSKTVVDFHQERLKEIHPVRSAPGNLGEFEAFQAEIQHKVRELTKVGSFRPEHGIFVPDRSLEGGAYARGVAVVVSDRGRNDSVLRRRVIDPIIAAGYQVVALDLRGWGETAPRIRGAREDFDWESFFAYRGLEIGKPLLGQRMKDLLATTPTRVRRRMWTYVGVGGGALVAAHAATLDLRCEGLIAIDPPLSYRSLVEDPLTSHAFSGYVPGVLGAYDLRELYAAAAPRRCLVVNPRDSRGGVIPQVKCWEELDWTAQAFEGAGATDRFDVQSGLDTEKTRAALTDWLSKRA